MVFGMSHITIKGSSLIPIDAPEWGLLKACQCCLVTQNVDLLVGKCSSFGEASVARTCLPASHLVSVCVRLCVCVCVCVCARMCEEHGHTPVCTA